MSQEEALLRLYCNQDGFPDGTSTAIGKCISIETYIFAKRPMAQSVPVSGVQLIILRGAKNGAIGSLGAMNII